MENKYYTPTIEEFHVGFEYEYLNNTDNNWYKQIFNRGIGFDNNPSIDRCRVKHLDKEDIESLGFELSDYKGSKVYKINDIYYLWYSKTYDFAPHISIGIMINGEEEQYFRGQIKNKSELKRILYEHIRINRIGI